MNAARLIYILHTLNYYNAFDDAVERAYYEAAQIDAERDEYIRMVQELQNWLRKGEMLEDLQGSLVAEVNHPANS